MDAVIILRTWTPDEKRPTQLRSAGLPTAVYNSVGV